MSDSETDLNGVLCAGTCTTGNNEDAPLTMDTLNEAMELIKALAPKEAPDNCLLIKGVSGLNIMKSDTLPENTVMVSKRLFDLIYKSSSTQRLNSARERSNAELIRWNGWLSS